LLAPRQIYDGFFRQNSGTDTAVFSLGSAWHLYNPLSTPVGWDSRTNGQWFYTYDRTGHSYGCAVELTQLGRDNSNRFRGAVAEFLLFKRALTADERAVVEANVNSRHSLW
jgi:hypothetical protein